MSNDDMLSEEIWHCQQMQRVLWYTRAGVADDGPNPIGSDDDFAALPAHAPSQQATAAAAANPAAGGGATAAAGSGLVWNKNQEYALHDYVTSLMDLQGGHDDNPRLWEDVAAKSDLWGPNRVSAAELREVYLRVSGDSSRVSQLSSSSSTHVFRKSPSVHVFGCHVITSASHN